MRKRNGWFTGERSKNNEWYTPKYILDPLGPFDLDPCAPLVRPFDIAKVHYTVKDDGLRQPWFGRVWLNPPYETGKKEKWMEFMAFHGNGIALIFNCLGTHWFDDLVMPYCSGLFFLTGKLKFIRGGGGEAGQAPHQSVLIAYDPPGECRNYMALKTCRLPGNFWGRRASDKSRSRTSAKNTLSFSSSKPTSTLARTMLERKHHDQ